MSLFASGECVKSRDVADPLQKIERYQRQFMSAPAPELPVFHGGLVGYFGYDTVCCTKSKLMDSCPPDELPVPDILLMLAEQVLIFDGLRGILTMVVNADATRDNVYEAALARLDDIEAALASASAHAQFGSITLDPALGDFDDSAIRYRTWQSEYEGWVERIREHILEGEAMQVVPSQRLSLPLTAPPLSLH